MNDFKALKQIKFSIIKTNRTILVRKTPSSSPPPLLKTLPTKAESIFGQSLLSESEMKLIDVASIMAMERLKKYLVISTRSRFGLIFF